MERKKIHRFKSKILDTKNLTPTTKHLTISTLPEFDFFPGQFISIILKKGGREIRRPYSIASKPSPNSLDLCIKILPEGLATPVIDTYKVGDEIDILGPMGAFMIKPESNNKNLVLISTGTGITPFRSMVSHLLENNFQNKIILITGYRYENDTLYEQEFKDLQEKHPNFSYNRICSRSNENNENNENNNYRTENGYVQKLVEKNLDENNHYYICGLKDMVNSVKDLLQEKGISDDCIFFEKYD